MTSAESMSRETAEQLLPFLANGTLQGQERAFVETWVGRDTALKADLAALRAIRAQMQEETPDYSPGAFGLARLLRNIETEDSSTKDAPRPIGRRVDHTPWPWPAAAAIAVALFIGQSVLTFGGFRAYSGYELAGPDPVSEPYFRVGFAPLAPETEIRELLLDAEVSITDGPSAMGLYTLRPLPGRTMEAAEIALRAGGDILETFYFEDPR